MISLPQFAVCRLTMQRERLRRALFLVLTGLLSFAWLALLSVQPAYAQFTRYQNYTDEQGLGDLTVTSIAQDKDGYMLLGTQGGLYRYDGLTISSYDTAFGMPGSTWVREVLCDAAGRVWVVTTSGIYVRFGSTFSPVDVGAKRLKAASPHVLAALSSSIVVQAGGTLLRASIQTKTVGTFAPVFDPATLAVNPRLGSVGFVVSDGHDGVLFGCGDGLCSLDANGKLNISDKADGLPPDIWQVALRTGNGALWVRSLDHLAYKPNGAARFKVIDVPGRHDTYFAGHAAELDLIADRHNGVLTQADDGFLQWDGKRLQSHRHHVGGVPDAGVLAFQFDREGALWLGSVGGGAYRGLGADQWEHWTVEDGLPGNSIWAMARLPDGHVWVAADGRSSPLDRSSDGVPGSNYVLAVTQHGRLWTAPFGAPLTRLDPSRGIVEHVASIGVVKGANVDQQNRLWLSTSDAVFMVADADGPASLTVPRLIASISGVLDITTDASGSTWLASSDGVFRWREDTGLVQLTTPEALIGLPFTATFAPTGDMWIATQTAGVLRFTVKGDHLVPLSPLLTPEIASNDTLFIHRDLHGRMWVGTDRGIDMFDGRLWRRFDSSDGPITNDMNQSAILEDADGSMWFGTSHGLSHLLDPNHLPPRGMLHTPLITNVSLGDKALPPQPAIETPWVRGPLTIHFDDLDFSSNRNTRFLYRISGIDTTWNETAGRTIQYAAPPPGNLNFNLLALDPTHNTRSPIVSFNIHIRAPWWQQQVVYWLVAVAAILLIAVAWRMRVQFLMRQQGLLEVLVRVRTTEIEQAREELYHHSMLEQQRLEEMVNVRTAEIEEARRELQRLAMSDMLTSLPNRRAIMLTLEAAIEKAERAMAPLAVLLCDVDNFKSINDQFGHLAGDHVLAEFGARLHSALSGQETAGRYGGEEFLVVLPDDATKITARVEEIRTRLKAAPYLLDGATRMVTVSAGLAFLRPGDTAVTLVARADVALYLAKENGRDRVEIEQDWQVARRRAPSIIKERDLEHEIRAALNGGELALHFQPVVDINRDVITSCEALLRWWSPTRGNVPPSDFIPFAEQNGLMPEVGMWVLRNACLEAVNWPESIRVSINLSPSQFYLAGIVDSIVEILADTKLPAERLELEVTETAMIVDLDAASAVLGKLRALGITIALDDFGTGYSSLSLLRSLPFDRIKIDRSFVKDLGIKADASAIIGGVIHLCAGIGATVTAEGVETAQQIEVLRASGCCEVQGFGIGHPAPAIETRAWINAFRASHAEASRSVNY